MPDREGSTEDTEGNKIGMVLALWQHAVLISVSRETDFKRINMEIDALLQTGVSAWKVNGACS